MIKNFHKKYHKGDLSIKDYLAAHRTVLANDRTWLAYIRTSLTFFIAGLTFIQFFKYKIIVAIGIFFIPVGIIILAIGIHKYYTTRSMIKKIG